MKNNERGASLIELLAVILITSLIVVLVWSVFFQGTTYSNKSISKSFMQQEANAIILQLKKIHRTYDSYTVSTVGCSIQIEGKLRGTTQTERFNNDKLCLQLNGMPATEITSNETTLIPFTLLITDKENLVNLDQFITDDNLKDKTRLVRVNSSLYKLT